MEDQADTKATNPQPTSQLQQFPQRPSRNPLEQGQTANTGIGQPNDEKHDEDVDSDDGEAFVARRRRDNKQSILPSAAFLAPKRRPSSVAPRPRTTSTTTSSLGGIKSAGRSHPSEESSGPFSQQTGIQAVQVDSISQRGAQDGDEGTQTKPKLHSEQRGQWGSSDTSLERGQGMSKNSRPGTSQITRTPKHSTATSRGPLLSNGAPSDVRFDGHDPLSDKHAEETSAQVSIFDALKTPAMGNGHHQSRSSGNLKEKAGSAQFAAHRTPAYPFSPPGFTLEAPKSRNYEMHKGANRFLVSGLLVTADANPLAFIGSVALVLVLGALWVGFEAPFYWTSVSPAIVIIFLYMWLSVTVNMLVTAWKDPGIVPRDLDRDPPMTNGDPEQRTSQARYDPDDPLYTPLPRVIRIRNGQDLSVKWCETCKTYRPPRSSHCRICDNCVDLIDHHCNFLNTCIARRNYASFFAFLVYSILISIMILVTSAVHLYLVTLPTTTALPGSGSFGRGFSFAEALRDTPISAVLFLLMIVEMIPICTLFFYHMRLVIIGRTTAEEIRISTNRDYTPKSERESNKRPILNCRLGLAGEDPNPFAHRNPFRNAGQVLMRPTVGIESYINRRGWKRRDERSLPPIHSPSVPHAMETAHSNGRSDCAGNALGSADEPYALPSWTNTIDGEPLSSSSHPSCSKMNVKADETR